MTTTSRSVETLFSSCDENDHDVRLAAEENISKLVKVRLWRAIGFDHYCLYSRIQVELHRIIKRNPTVGALSWFECETWEICSGALRRFAELANVIHPKTIRAFFEHLFAAFCSIAARPEDIVHDKLAD